MSAANFAVALDRIGCCGTRQKPCMYHEGFGNGFDLAEQTSATPDTETALEEIVSVLGPMCWHGCNKKDCRASRIARTAIAKAKGACLPTK